MIERRVVNNAVKALLEEATGRPVEIEIAPSADDSNAWADLPYVVVTPGGGLPFSGAPFCDMYEDASFGYQITSVGERQDQVEAVADRVRLAFLGRDRFGFIYDLNITGVNVMLREPMGPPGRMQREGRIYNVVDSFMLRLTSSGEDESGS